MRLQKLVLKNFKGLRDFKFFPMGDDASIYGDNGTGKTTVMDAFVWLLTDKDSLNSANFGIKTLAGGAPISNIEHEVEGVFDVDGREITLRKVFSEKFTKKRGSAQADFTGHTTDYFVNGVPVKLKGFQEKIAEIARPELFRLLTSPRYVNEEMKWDQRRRLLIEVCGDVSDADVIATNPGEFARIPAWTDKKTVDEYRQEIAYRKTGINKELTAIPVRIDELSKTLPAGDHVGDTNKLIADKAALESSLAVLRNELSMIESGGAVGIKKKEILDLQNQIQALEAAHKKAVEAVMDKRLAAEREAEGVAFTAKQKALGISSDIGQVDIEIKALTSAVEALRKKWHEENGKVFTPPEVSATCPTCGQSIPESQIEETIKTAQADFNRIKAGLLESIQRSGKEHSEKLSAVNAREAELIKSLKEQDARSTLAKEAHLKTIKALTEPAGIPEPGEIYSLKAKALRLDAELGELAIGGHDAAAEVYAQIEAATVSIDTINKALAEIETAGKTRERITELMADEKRLAGEYEQLEADLHILEEFTRAKCGMLTDRINSKFKITRWKLFEEQINGGLKDCCIATVGGVPYGDLNNAARINAGLDCINALSAYHGVSLPVFIDNAESIVETLQASGQMIRLVVSAADKTLRVVCHEAGQKAA
jgi:DNA repair exonuclease SbcCD ATPase subunit